MKITTIIGARPQFIKAAPVSRAIAEHNRLTEIIIHTGQHFDADMSDVFFKELNISRPDYNLGINSASHGAMTGRMLEKIEEILIKEKPDSVLVYGDTNSTLAGALATVKLHIPLAHVEAGLRSFNRKMPEEHNRVITDHCSDLLFCPTQMAVNNLQKEGFSNIANNGRLIDINFNRPLTTDNRLLVVNVGDTMYDAALQFSGIAQRSSTILKALGLRPKDYLLATVHRPYNTDIPENLQNILSAFFKIGEPIIFPVHPRTRQRIKELGLNNQQSETRNLQFIDPVGYLDMLVLEQNARLILTDSGGMQKEAYFFGIPCVTLRPETEWIETVEAGWNVVVGSDNSVIVEKTRTMQSPAQSERRMFGDGHAGKLIVQTLENSVLAGDLRTRIALKMENA